MAVGLRIKGGVVHNSGREGVFVLRLLCRGRGRSTAGSLSLMATVTKPKKRSRLALPRQKGASTASAAAGGVQRSTSSDSGLLGASSQQQSQPSSAAVAADDGTSTPTNSSPGASSGSVGLRPASPGEVLSGRDGVQPAQRTAARATAGDHRRVPSATTTVNDVGGHREHQQPVPAACESQGQIEKVKEEKQQERERKDVECHARRVSDDKQPRDPLQTLRLNGRPEATAAGAGGKGLQQATATATAAAAAAAVAAAALEVTQLLDGLEPKDNMEGRPSSVRAAPPAAREPAGSSDHNNQQRQRHGGAGKARSNLQHQHQHQESAGRKRRRPFTTTTVVTSPSSSHRTVSPPASTSASRPAPAPPSPERGRPPPPPPPPPAPTAEEAAGDVVMINHDQEAKEKSLPRVPMKSAGGSGRSTGGETGAAEHRRPHGLPSLEKEEPSPEQRGRCPVCSRAVWGLSVRARQASLENVVDTPS